MEEVQLWSLDGADTKRLPMTEQLESESGLEDILVNNPDLLMEDLTLVGRQTPTEVGPLDLLGVDGDGRLVVFELKRGTLARDAVAQVIDYASDLDHMDLDVLSNHISRQSGNHGVGKIEDFLDWYTNELGFESLESLKPLRLFLVGLGVDGRTERMVKFLSENSGMDISLLTFHGFTMDGKTILAKQVEVDGADVPSPKQKRPSLSRDERLKILSDSVDSLGVGEAFSGIRELFMEEWTGGSSRIIRNAAYMLLGRIWYVRMIPESGRVRIAFYPWVINLCVSAFNKITAEIPYETHKGKYQEYGDEIHLLITPDIWNTHKENLTELVKAVYKAWEAGGSVE